MDRECLILEFSNTLFTWIKIKFFWWILKELEAVVFVRVSKEIYGICRGSLIFAFLH